MVAIAPHRYARPVEAFGNPEDPRETNADASFTTAIALWRGMLWELQNLEITFNFQKADGAAFVQGTDSVIPHGFVFDEVAGAALSENAIAAARIDSKRAMIHVLEDATTRGRRMTVNADGSINVGFTAGAAVDTELPTAAALADATANPTITAVGTFGQVYNGATWDRARTIVNATNSTGTGIQAVGLVAQFDDTSPTAITENQFGNLRMSGNRNLYQTLRDAAGNERGQNVDANSQALAAPGSTTATGGIPSTGRLVSAAASTNATSVKASAGRLYAIQGYNAAAAVRYLKLYNKASAPTVGTDTPVKTIALPPGAGFALDWAVGYQFATGIAFALTTGSADADTGAVAAGDILGLNLDYA